MIDCLFVTKNQKWMERLATACQSLGLTHGFASDFDAALIAIENQDHRLIFCDIEDEELRVLQVMEWMNTRYLSLLKGVLTSKSHSPIYLQAMRLGSQLGLNLEIISDNLLQAKLSDWCVFQKIKYEIFVSQLQINPSQQNDDLIGGSDKMLQLWVQLHQLRKLQIPMCIVGERGTGKRFLVDLLIKKSNSENVFNFDAEIIEDYRQKSQFHEEVLAFVSQAGDQSATLFVHEVGYLHLELQELLVEYLKDGVLRLGDHISPQWQVIVSTTLDLEVLVKKKQFREDLFLILKQHEIVVPALRDRSADIPPLANHFLKLFQSPGRHLVFSQDAMEALVLYKWPGNLSELRETMRKTVENATGDFITGMDLPAHVLEDRFYKLYSEQEDLSDLSYNEAKKRVLNKFNATYIAEILKKSDQNLTVAAEMAGMDRSNFKKIIKKYGLG